MSELTAIAAISSRDMLGPALNLATMALIFAVFMVVGTALFVRRGTNR
jgi:hypothetical protein